MLIGDCWCDPTSECPVWSGGVVCALEFSEELVELVEVLACWPGSDPSFEGLVEPFDFALGGGMPRFAVLLSDP